MSILPVHCFRQFWISATISNSARSGQPQETPVSQISDGQPQAPTAAPVSQISDGQPQAPGPTKYPTATIDVGEVVGTTTLLPSATVTVDKYLGIPFAVSPPERFSPPVPVGKFAKPVVAQAWAPACIQQFVCE